MDISKMKYALLILAMACAPKKGFREEQVVNHQKPNIIIIMADDLGWGDLGYNGQQKIKTPNIDMLARGGMIFNRIYAGSTVCGPSRASLLTGLHTGHGEVRGNPKWSLSGNPVDFDPAHNTIAEVLKEASYRTGVVGKWGLAENLGPTVPNQQGFDYFYGFNKHLPAHHYYPTQIWENDSLLTLGQNNTALKQGDHVQELFTGKAIDFLAEESENPFFLYLAYTTPHFELTIPDPFKTQYDTLDWPLRKMKPGHYYHDENGHVTYAAMVSKMDADIARLIDQLKRQGDYENTLIIFTSDNGHEYDKINNEFFDSNGHFRGKKRDLYDGGIHVPFLVHWPDKIAGGQSSDHLAAFWDIKTTLADLMEVPLTEATDGVSFLPTLSGSGKQKNHDHLYWEFNERAGPLQAVIKEDWKLIHQVEHSSYQLYDLQQDPSEKSDLSDKFPQELEKLKSVMRNARTENLQFPLTRRPDPWKKK